MKTLFITLVCFLSALFPCAIRADVRVESLNPNTKEQTFVMIKPNAVASHHIGDIISRFEKSGLKISAIKMTKLTQSKAQQFYAAHKEKPFFQELVNFMVSGPVVAITLEGDDAVAKSRDIIGATDPKKAASGTIRADFGQDVTRNAIHGSDSREAAKNEIAFFFTPADLN